MKNKFIDNWISKERKLNTNDAVEISKKDFLKIIELLNDPFAGFKPSTARFCSELICEYCETQRIKKLPCSEDEKEKILAMRMA